MSTAVLHSDSDLTTVILDIPASIADGQGGGRVFSVPAQDQPYITPEPKGQKRLEFIARLAPEDVTYHHAIQDYIHKALQRVPPGQIWCLPRLAITLGPDAYRLCPAISSCLPIVLSPLPNRFSSHAEIQHCIVSNGELTTSLTVADTSYIIPRRCKFIWSSIEQSAEILADISESPSFKIVLMDPPWPNRSVKKTKTYSTMHRNEPDILLEAIALAQRYCSRSGHIAIWITNKHVIRCQVLEEMITQGFELAEEWIWLKVTSEGKPVTVLDGVWRKPYEILLVFRQCTESLNTRRRFVFAVPDMHSRKPNLKYLFETIFGSGPVLELFARNLTSGWWSIGDEVLKFQDSNLWQQSPG